MKTYKNTDGNSGVSTYEYGKDWIRIRFKNGTTYEYRSAKIGVHHLDQMKQLADLGNGLNAYINNHPRIEKGYSARV
ncbi:MAG: hypothetical protein LBV12_09265 [Puniceicoccales bacterium]|jgi:hypothetical protein|nr:hypothetical protein [Puniceicoccales bacterium]